MADGEVTQRELFGQGGDIRERNVRIVELYREGLIGKVIAERVGVTVAVVKNTIFDARQAGLVGDRAFPACSECGRPLPSAKGRERGTCCACHARNGRLATPLPKRSCIDCGTEVPNPRGKGRRADRCESCNTIRNEGYQLGWRTRRMRNGICPKCGGPYAGTASACAECVATRKAIRHETKRRCMEGYGGRCACCGISDLDCLSIDHVNDDGAEHRRTATSRSNLLGYHMYRRVIREGFPADYACLCMSCNWGRRLCGVCPCRSVGVMGGDGEGI